ncbi:MAG: FKBP-type peptidyl-prolyl cis-trans isomerase [Lachnospiraceae bacterium]|nr:FKBP-type peptidyl-prolyl cis-trans isomerase [Lachnospiraceae bacterium]
MTKEKEEEEKKKPEKIKETKEEKTEKTEETKKEKTEKVEKEDKAEPKKVNIWLIVICGVLVVAIIVLAVLLILNKKKNNAEAEPTETTETTVTETTVTTEPAETTDPAEGVTSVLDLNIEDYVQIDDYREIEVTMPAMDDSMEEYAEHLAKQQYSQLAASVTEDAFIKDRPVKDGDMINLDYSGKIDGEVFEGGTAQNQALWIGSDSFIDGFEDGLIGVYPGETVDLNLTFPETYSSEELAGKEAVFTCTINGIIPEEAIIAVWNAGAYEDTQVESYAGFVQFIKDYVNAMVQDQNEAEVSNTIIDELLNRTEYKQEFPQSLIDKYRGVAETNLTSEAVSYGYDNDSYAMAAYGMSAEDYIESNSYTQLKMDASLAYIAKKEGITVSLDDAKQRLAAMLVEYGYDDYNAAVQELQLDEELYRVYFLEEDVIAFLKTAVKMVQQ